MEISTPLMLSTSIIVTSAVGFVGYFVVVFLILSIGLRLRSRGKPISGEAAPPGTLSWEGPPPGTLSWEAAMNANLCEDLIRDCKARLAQARDSAETLCLTREIAHYEQLLQGYQATAATGDTSPGVGYISVPPPPN